VATVPGHGEGERHRLILVSAMAHSDGDQLHASPGSGYRALSTGRGQREQLCGQIERGEGRVVGDTGLEPMTLLHVKFGAFAL
jgi:hypothetical protein